MCGYYLYSPILFVIYSFQTTFILYNTGFTRSMGNFGHWKKGKRTAVFSIFSVRYLLCSHLVLSGRSLTSKHFGNSEYQYLVPLLKTRHWIRRFASSIYISDTRLIKINRQKVVWLLLYIPKILAIDALQSSNLFLICKWFKSIELLSLRPLFTMFCNL
jgi:hypothetical protein